MAGDPLRASLAVLQMLREERFQEVCDLFAPQLRAVVSPRVIQSAWEAEISRQGRIAGVGTPLVEDARPGLWVVKVPVTCQHGGMTLVASLAADDRLLGLQLVPGAVAAPAASWSTPPYADPELFDEAEVVLGAALSVPGTLCVPRRKGPLPGIVLLAGSGPNDRDETIGPNKPLKDLAWGLASCGIAVLRFDKVTFAHPDEVRALPGFTLADEYLPQAVAAVELMRRHPAVDARRVFLLGHSLGGTVAPRVAAQVPHVAGLVLLAAGIEPLHWNIVRQVRYIASLTAEGEASAAQAIAVLTDQARRVDSPDLTPATPATELPLGVPASYWLDLRAYEPGETLARLDKPVLLLQGGRDYQVTVEEDLRVWQAALAGRANVTSKVYAADNHCFFVGSGPSSPADYEAAQNVDPEVVSDVADWLGRISAGVA